MRLELGKRYRCRNGNTVRIFEINRGSIWGEYGSGPTAMKMAYDLDGNVRDMCGSAMDIIGPAEPELMFSFREPAPQYSATVSEADLKRMIDEVRLCDFRKMSHGEAKILAAAAERMIELAKAPAPKPERYRLNMSTSIRFQLAELLRDIGLEPDRFLTKPPSDAGSVHMTKEPNAVCLNGTSATNNTKDRAEKAAIELSQLMGGDLKVDITPIVLRLWLNERWEKVAELAHKIHGG